MNNVNIIGSGTPGTPTTVGFEQVHDEVTFHVETKPHGAS
jgi:hypothetical protein